MIIHCINEKELQMLKSLIGAKLICFKSEQKDSWNRIFGNIALITDKTEIELRNELTEIEYFGETEEVSKFYVNQITAENPFCLMVQTDVFETTVNETITDIIIVKDEVVAKDTFEKTIYEITTDDAVIIKTDSSAYVISRDWHLEEFMLFVKTTDIQRDVRSVADIIDEWSDEEDGTVATCNRKEISLLEK